MDLVDSAVQKNGRDLSRSYFEHHRFVAMPVVVKARSYICGIYGVCACGGSFSHPQAVCITLVCIYIFYTVVLFIVERWSVSTGRDSFVLVLLLMRSFGEILRSVL